MPLITLLAPLLLCAAPATPPKPYRVPAGLAGVVKGEKARGLPRAAKLSLEKDASVVVGGSERHFFSVYDKNAYEGVPSFITLDVLLHLFHLRFDELVASAELARAVPELSAFSAAGVQRALSSFPDAGVPEPRVRSLALYHAVPLAFLRPEEKPDPRIAEEVAQAVAALQKGSGAVQTAACPGSLDAARFKPRGHYAGWALQGYFRAVTFYSQCAFELGKPAGLSRALDVVRAADAPARKHLEEVVSLQRKIAGPGDDPGLAALAALLPRDAPAWPAPLPSAALSGIAAKALSLPAARVPDVGVRGPVLRLLGGAGAPDAALFGRTVHPSSRPMPSALDVLAALGSKDAKALLADDLAGFPGLGPALEAPLPTGDSGLYGKWLAVLGLALIRPGADAPSFAQSPAWGRHQLVSAAGSWAELRHDTLLYVKQPIVWAEGGDSSELPAAKAGGYVEPRPEVYRALLSLLDEVKALGPGEREKARVAELGGLLGFVTEVSRIELEGGPMPREADERLREIGAELEHLTRGHADALPPQALVADVFTGLLPEGGGRVLYAGVGNADELWVVVPRGGKLLLTRGAVFSYYELTRDAASRLDDRDWMELLAQKPGPERPAWARPQVELPRKPRSRD